MTEKSIHDLVKGIVFEWGGQIHLVEDLTRPYFDELENDLRKEGFQDQISNPKWHTANAKTYFTADLGITPLVIGIGLFLSSSIGSWAVGKVCDEYLGKTKKAYAVLKKKFKKMSNNSGVGPTQVNFSFEVYYENDQLSVIVEGIANTTQELESIENLMPEAQKRALAWIEKNGITAGEIRYTIRNGELSEYPRLSGK